MKLSKKLETFQNIESVGKLANKIAHDFNNILTGISGYATLLLMENNLSQDVRFMISGIKSLTENATDFMEILRSLDPTRSIDPSIIDINSVIKDHTDVLKNLTHDNVKLKINVDGDIPISVNFDPQKFKQLLINLVTNSIDAIRGSGEVAIKTEIIENDGSNCPNLEEFSTGKVARLSITDDGIGIPDSNIEKIFDPFFTTKAREKRLGLGLSVAYGVVTHFGGCIEVNPLADQGATFHVILPLKEDVLIDEPSVKDNDLKSSTSPGMIVPKKTILVVDDNQSILSILSQTLIMRKFNVIVTSNPLEGLQILQDNASNIDLVISDIVMPELSGIDLIERSVTIKPDLKVIFITGYVQVPSIQKRVENLNFPILTKPFDFEILVDLVVKTLDEKN